MLFPVNLILPLSQVKNLQVILDFFLSLTTHIILISRNPDSSNFKKYPEFVHFSISIVNTLVSHMDLDINLLNGLPIPSLLS